MPSASAARFTSALGSRPSASVALRKSQASSRVEVRSRGAEHSAGGRSASPRASGGTFPRGPAASRLDAVDEGCRFGSDVALCVDGHSPRSILAVRVVGVAGEQQHGSNGAGNADAPPDRYSASRVPLLFRWATITTAQRCLSARSASGASARRTLASCQLLTVLGRCAPSGSMTSSRAGWLSSHPRASQRRRAASGPPSCRIGEAAESERRGDPRQPRSDAARASRPVSPRRSRSALGRPV